MPDQPTDQVEEEAPPENVSLEEQAEQAGENPDIGEETRHRNHFDLFGSDSEDGAP